MARKKSVRRRSSLRVRVDGQELGISANPRLPARPRIDRVVAAMDALLTAIETYGSRADGGNIKVVDRASAVHLSAAWDAAESLTHQLWCHVFAKHGSNVGFDPVETAEDLPLVPALTAARKLLQLPEDRVGPAGRYQAKDTIPANEVEELRRIRRILKPEQIPAKGAFRKKKRRGRPVANDPKRDKRIADAWHTNHYRTKTDLARALNLPLREVHLALERHRKRTN